MSQQRFKECLSQLQAAMRAAALYPDGHTGIQTPLRNFTQNLRSLLAEMPAIVLGVMDDVLVVDECPFYETDGIWRPLYRAMTEAGLESISFQQGIEPEEVLGIIRILKRTEGAESFDLASAWKEQEITHASYRESVDGDDLRAQAQRTYGESLAIVTDLMSELRLGKIPTGSAAVKIIGDMRDIVLQDASAMLSMSMMKSYDRYTYVHSVNVAIFCLAFGHFIELPSEELRVFGLAGLLHDMGKVLTDEAILKKPGVLSDEETRIIQLHPESGADILKSMNGINSDATTMVLQHHVRFDRQGYPKLPTTAELHPLADAVGIADCYDALTTTRTYQRSRHPSDAMLIIRNRTGTAYSTETVEKFISMLGTYPTGEAVRLATGEIAVVVANNPMDATRPTVRLVIDADGNKLVKSVRLELSDPSESSRKIVTPVDPLAKGIDTAAVLKQDMDD